MIIVGFIRKPWIRAEYRIRLNGADDLGNFRSQSRNMLKCAVSVRKLVEYGGTK
ncbi:hypothetical protein D3C75_618700 [compost metagenome]